MAEPILVIWNAKAGSGWQHSEVRNELERRPDVVLCDSPSKDEATDIVRRAADDGVQLVVAAGGDGTVNAVVNGLAESSEGVRMAILPLGTGNDFCRTLAIPSNPMSALRILDSPTVRRIDIVEAEHETHGRYFINMASGGNSHRVTEHLNDEMKQRWGPFCYVRGVVDVLPDLQRFHATICLDDGPTEHFNLFNVFLGNGRTCGAGLRVAPTANPEDGLLEVMIVLDGGPIDVATLAARFLVNHFLDSEMVVRRRARRVSIDSEPKMLFVTDGDATTEVPATFTVHPQALEVVVGTAYRRTLAEFDRDSQEETVAPG